MSDTGLPQLTAATFEGTIAGGVEVVPTHLPFKDGAEIDRFTGVQKADMLISRIENVA